MGPGLSESEARAQALSQFGNRTLHLDDRRAVWRWAWLDSAVDTGNPTVPSMPVAGLAAIGQGPVARELLGHRVNSISLPRFPGAPGRADRSGPVQRLPCAMNEARWR